MSLQEVSPGALAALGTRVEAMLFQDVLDCRLGDRPDAKLLELTENPAVPKSDLVEPCKPVCKRNRALPQPI